LFTNKIFCTISRLGITMTPGLFIPTPKEDCEARYILRYYRTNIALSGNSPFKKAIASRECLSSLGVGIYFLDAT